MNRLRTLDALAACLRGEPPTGCDWRAVVELANQSLVTPQLAAALLQTPAREAPPPIAGFLAEVLRRNGERNQRLWRQLMDAVAVLNAAEVTPTVLKGAALWLWSGGHRDRLMSDLDLLVEPSEVEAAIVALRAAGFDVVRAQQGATVHVVAELARPKDPGCIDLHQRPPGPPGLIEHAGRADRRLDLQIDGLRLRIPDPAMQCLQLVLHDQFHDGDFWRGGYDLRHALDLRQLAPALTPEDWAWLNSACGSALVRTALGAQFVAARRLAGGPLPPPSRRWSARWTERRWRLQYGAPRLRPALAAAAAALHASQLQAHRRAERRGRGAGLPGEIPSGRSAARLERLADIMTVRSGKI